MNKFSLHGEIVRLDAENKVATIHHQKVEGYMESMTMSFPVKDAQEFAALQTGNCIDATLFVQGDSFWVGDIKKVDVPQGMCVTPPPPDSK